MKMIGDELLEKKNEENNNKKPNLWKDGKKQYKDFTNYHVKKSTFLITTFQGLLVTLIIVLPIILLLSQFYIAYSYIPSVRNFIIVVAFGLLLVCNGLSNLFTVKFTKTHATDDEKLQAFDEFKIFFYTTFQIGFIIFAFIIMLVVMVIGYTI